MSDQYKKQPLFNEVANKDMQAWNRCAVFFNMFADHGKVPAQMYAAQFNEEDRKSLIKMFDRVKTNGYEATRKTIYAEV